MVSLRHLLTAIGIVAAVTAGAMLVSLGQDRLRAPRPLLPLTFAHADHVTENCVLCHHNFLDATGQGLCLDCHKTDPEVNPLIETQFHDLCRGCHVEKQLAGDEGGPTRVCIDCHAADNAP